MNKRDWRVSLISVGVTLGVVLAIALVMYFLSFKIVYDPELITSWEAVSGVASWFSIIVSIAAVAASVVAIVYAIRVPKEIAERQDRITLFEKRFVAYYELKKHLAFSNMIESANSYDEILTNAKSVFGFSFLDKAELFKYDDFHTTVFVQLPFLFPNINNADCINLANISAQYFVNGIAKKYNENAKRMLYVHEVRKFLEKYDEILKDCLRLYK